MSARLEPELHDWMEAILEWRFDLKINRDKTRVVDLKEPKTSLNFLGYTFSFGYKYRNGGRSRFHEVIPSKKSVRRAKDRVRELTERRRNSLPVKTLINPQKQLNQKIKRKKNKNRITLLTTRAPIGDGR